MRLLCLPILACLWPSVAGADVMYTFSYDAVSGPVHSFTFSFTTPVFVTDGSSPAFTPFSPTDGSNSWTMTKDSVALLDPTGLNRGCFMLGTPFAGLGLPLFLGGPCGIAVGGPGNTQAAIEFDTSGGLPVALGTYDAVHFGGIFDTAAGTEFIGPLTDIVDNTGTMTLVITKAAVPEPSGLSLTVIGLLVLGGVGVRRSVTGEGHHGGQKQKILD